MIGQQRAIDNWKLNIGISLSSRPRKNRAQTYACAAVQVLVPAYSRTRVSRNTSSIVVAQS